MFSCGVVCIFLEIQRPEQEVRYSNGPIWKVAWDDVHVPDHRHHVPVDAFKTETRRASFEAKKFKTIQANKLCSDTIMELIH
jgi:hypothetical protein